MKRIDYYAAPQPWKVPKWMGATLGVIFSAVAVMALSLIVHLTRPAHADVPPPEPTAAIPAPAAAAPLVTALPVQTEVAPAVHSAPASHVKHAKVQKKAKGKATRSLASSKGKSTAMLARHDSRDKRKQKDDLDRLLGL